MDTEFEIIKDKYGWVLINVSKKNRLAKEAAYSLYTNKINWKKCHTHVKSLRNAILMRDNLIKMIIPKYNTQRILKSYIRVSDNESYKGKIRMLISEIRHNSKISNNLAKRIEREEVSLKNFNIDSI